MSALRDVAEDYLRMRRALGYKLEIQGLLLNRFVSYLEDINAETVTIENAVAWATLPAAADPSYWAGRLSVVRQFARHLQTLDPACEVPPARLLPYRSRRAIPYLYEPEEIIALMDAAGQLEPPLLAANYRTLTGLLSVTGLRLGEAIRLDRVDVDDRHQLLRILDTGVASRRCGCPSASAAALHIHGACEPREHVLVPHRRARVARVRRRSARLDP